MNGRIYSIILMNKESGCIRNYLRASLSCYSENANCKPSARIKKVMLSNGEICAYNLIFP